eukprot:CAMPEP_0171664882 /NCGR_PEP_ID=MMETSP0990-20121206/47085_1 /TAXON_ID=483369 /ORGANISM="non described non described, Strain CCMP2098" /LENGTH=84 /DNA_ID=CAMNT_0012247919 /DNA_START=244 /DNA_END=494 /DNA_ORIENTATION=+
MLQMVASKSGSIATARRSSAASPSSSGGEAAAAPTVAARALLVCSASTGPRARAVDEGGPGDLGGEAPKKTRPLSSTSNLPSMG